MGASIDGGGSSRRPRQLAEINVTPLVDVMLVLLIISMVAAPMLERSVDLELPNADHEVREVSDVRYVVSLDRDGRYYINEKPVHAALLVERIRGIAERATDPVIYLRADRNQYYGEVMLLMDKIREGGVTNISLVTIPTEDAGS